MYGDELKMSTDCSWSVRSCEPKHTIFLQKPGEHKYNFYLEKLCFVCLFELMLNVPVISNGHVGTLPPFYGTFTQH